MPPAAGDLQVTILCATSFDDVGCMGRSRYLIKLELGLRSLKTKWDNGKWNYPIWDQAFTVNLTRGAPHNLRFICKSNSLIKATVVGFADVDLRPVFRAGPHHLCLSLFKNGKQTCRVTAVLKYTPSPSSATNSMGNLSQAMSHNSYGNTAGDGHESDDEPIDVVPGGYPATHRMSYRGYADGQSQSRPLLTPARNPTSNSLSYDACSPTTTHTSDCSPTSQTVTTPSDSSISAFSPLSQIQNASFENQRMYFSNGGRPSGATAALAPSPSPPTSFAGSTSGGTPANSFKHVEDSDLFDPVKPNRQRSPDTLSVPVHASHAQDANFQTVYQGSQGRQQAVELHPIGRLAVHQGGDGSVNGSHTAGKDVLEDLEQPPQHLVPLTLGHRLDNSVVADVDPEIMEIRMDESPPAPSPSMFSPLAGGAQGLRQYQASFLHVKEQSTKYGTLGTTDPHSSLQP